MESASRELAVLAERQRALTDTKTSVITDRDRAIDEQSLSQERLTETEEEVARLETDFEEARAHLKSAQDALQARQSERIEDVFAFSAVPPHDNASILRNDPKIWWWWRPGAIEVRHSVARAENCHRVVKLRVNMHDGPTRVAVKI